MSDSDSAPTRRRRSRGPAPLTRVSLLLYYAKAEIYQQCVDIIGLPGARPGQQVELRHYICAGHEAAVTVTQEWVDDLNDLNPTTEARRKKRGFLEPPLPIEEHGESTEHAKYSIYFNRNIPAEEEVLTFLNETVMEMSKDYARQRLPRKLRQIYLRAALIAGMKKREQPFS